MMEEGKVGLWGWGKERVDPLLTMMQGLDHGDNLDTVEHKRPNSMAALLRMDEGRWVVELNTAMENLVHGPIEGHEHAPETLVVVKEHTVRRHVDRGMAKDRRRGNRCTKGEVGGSHRRGRSRAMWVAVADQGEPDEEFAIEGAYAPSTRMKSTSRGGGSLLVCEQAPASGTRWATLLATDVVGSGLRATSNAPVVVKKQGRLVAVEEKPSAGKKPGDATDVKTMTAHAAREGRSSNGSVEGRTVDRVANSRAPKGKLVDRVAGKGRRPGRELGEGRPTVPAPRGGVWMVVRQGSWGMGRWPQA
jgi:hypothetical protein